MPTEDVVGRHHRKGFRRVLGANRSTQRTATVTVIDQGASSLSNFFLAVLVAHYDSAHALGIYALVITSYMLWQEVTRSLTSDCLLTRSGADPVDLVRYEKGGYLMALTLALSGGAVLAGIASCFQSSATTPLLLLAVACPGLALQDFSRYKAIGRQRPEYALALDLAWLALFGGAVALLLVHGLTSLSWLFGSWALTGAVVGMATLASQRFRRGRLEMLRWWLRRERGTGLRFAGQYLLNVSASQISIYFLAIVTAVVAAGWVKLAQVSFGPFFVMQAGVQSALISIGSRKRQAGIEGLTRFLVLTGITMGGIALMWTVVVYSLPVDEVSKVLGHSWADARTLTPLIGSGLVLGGFVTAATIGLRSLRAASAGLRLSAVMFPVALASCLIGAWLYGAKGYAGGTAIAFGLYAVISWLFLVRVLQAERADAGSGARSRFSDIEPVEDR